MVGKRVKKKKMRTPAVVVLLAAMLAVLTTAGPRGVAADSPLESAAEPAAERTVPGVKSRRRPYRRSPLPPFPRVGRWRIHILKTPRFWAIPEPRVFTCTAA